MSESDRNDGPSRRKVLQCMTWVGTGVLWTIAGGVPHALGIIDEAVAQEANGLTFLQISDSHVGFDKPANPNALGTLEEAIAKVNALPAKPAFMIHTGDISHLSKESEFDDAERVWHTARNGPQHPGTDPSHAFQNSSPAGAVVAVRFTHSPSPLKSKQLQGT